jgi:hypothetical protein
MTLLSPFHALAEKWQKSIGPVSHRNARKACANELTELLGKVVVSDELIENCFESLPWESHASRRDVRIILEYALGVTKC